MKQHDHLSSKEEIDNIKLWEINYASMVHTLLKGISEEEYEEMAKEQISASGLRIPEAYNPSIIPRYRHIYMWMIYGVLSSNECQLDIINELYLRCIQDKRDKEKLFLDIEADNGNIDMVKKDINDKMKQNIKNMKKDPGKYNFIFKTEEIGTGKGQMINSFGSEVVRLYFESKEFRKLFIRTETTYSKYSYRKILEILDKGLETGILTRKPESSIIIEKIFNLSSVKCMNYFICNLLNKMSMKNMKNYHDNREDRERREGREGIESQIIKLVDELNDIPGEYSRSLMIKLIQSELKESQCGPWKREQEQQAIELYVEVVKEVKKVFGRYYEDLVNYMDTEYRKIYSKEELFSVLENKRKQLFRCNMDLLILEMNRKNLHEAKTKCIKGYIDNDNKDMIENFWMHEENLWRIKPFYVEQRNEISSSIYFDTDNDFLNMIQQKIIQKNVLKYSI